MRNLLVLIIFTLLSTLFVSSVHATGNPYVKVDSFTLEGLLVVRQSGSAIHVKQVTIPGFNTEADCLTSISELQNRTYPGTTGSTSTIISQMYGTFHGTCHNVKVVVPVTPTP